MNRRNRKNRTSENTKVSPDIQEKAHRSYVPNHNIYTKKLQ
jgi:hypothetical protein